MPVKKLMTGFPPSPENQVTLDNWRQPPFNKWGFQHVSEITQTAPIYNDTNNIRILKKGSSDLVDLPFNHGDQKITVSQMIEKTDADGMIVLHKGRIVLEEYRNNMTDRSRHILFSVTKSVTALVAGVLVGRGKLDPDTQIIKYIPEIADTAFGDACVRNVLDMAVGLAFDEDYTATEGPIVQYRESAGWNSRTSTPPDMHLRDFLQTMTERNGAHGVRFSYMSPITDLLGWILERASGQRYCDLVSETLWQPMGAGYDAYMSIDNVGAPRTAGGFCATLRDLALVGQLICDDGKRGDKQIVPAEWIADIRNNGSREQWLAGDFAEDYTDWSMRYRSKWYVTGEGNVPCFGVGIHGQFVHANPANGVVVAQFSSQPDAVDGDKELMVLRACDAIGKALN
ncbi:MAG: serine hydrolase [Rhodospirillales bacterium]|jgi:CubicO group peptidase (beta-lactamase class C family)|nr:serine hydrolase [Rhodospirillales bacterium]